MSNTLSEETARLGFSQTQREEIPQWFRMEEFYRFRLTERWLLVWRAHDYTAIGFRNPHLPIWEDTLRYFSKAVTLPNVVIRQHHRCVVVQRTIRG